MQKIIFFISEDWNVLSHFRPMLAAAAAEGLEVVVATRVREHGAAIEQLGYRVVPLDAERRSLSPVEVWRTLARTVALLRREKPDIVHCVSVRQATLIGPIARTLRVPRLVVAPIGLGHLWIEPGALVTILRTVSRVVIGALLRSRRTSYVFENREDPREFWLDPDAGHVHIVCGAGVDADVFTVAPEPEQPPFKVAVLARMTAPKGIPESIDAASLARRVEPAVELHLFGEPDASNPRALTVQQLRVLCDRPGIAWHGAVKSADVPAVLAQHHAVMLLSHREGLPRVLVEACAAGRPIVATDVVGCREIVRNDVEGLLIPRSDAAAAADALIRLARDAPLRRRLATAARSRFEASYAAETVVAQFRALYSGLMRGRDCRPARTVGTTT